MYVSAAFRRGIGSFVNEVESRLQMLPKAPEELPISPLDREKSQTLSLALSRAQEIGEAVSMQLVQVTFDVCKHVSDLGSCSRCLHSGVYGLQVLEEVAEKVRKASELNATFSFLLALLFFLDCSPQRGNNDALSSTNLFCKG
jgi:hypothetical protein